MFYDVLNSLMKSKKVSRQDLTTALSIGKNQIKYWETHDNIPNMETLKKIADYFDVSVDYLLGNNTIPVSDVVFVPIYGKVAAGAGMFANDEIIGEQPVFSAMVKNIGECFCLRVSGDSMLPRIQDGDIILVRKQSSVDSGSYAVVLIDDENGVVKKVIYDKDSVTLISINPNYPPRTFSGADLQRLQVLGEVIQIISTLK